MKDGVQGLIIKLINQTKTLLRVKGRGCSCKLCQTAAGVQQYQTGRPGHGLSLVTKKLPLEEAQAEALDFCGSHWVALGGQRVVWEMEDTWMNAVTKYQGAPGQSTCDLIQDEGGFDQLWRYKNEETCLNGKMWDLREAQEEFPGAEKAFLRPVVWVPSGDFNGSMSSLLPRQRPTCRKEAR